MNKKLNRSPSFSPSASDNESAKLCLILEGTSRVQEKPCYYVFVLDSADAETDSSTTIPNREPTLRLDGLDDVTFCVLKSTLYIFECEPMSPVILYQNRLLDAIPSGSLVDDDDEDWDLDVIASVCQRKSVYSLDLTQYDSSSKMVGVIPKSYLHKLSDMFSVKVQASAIVTPRGKIFVYSTFISYDVYQFPQLLTSFELYDPDTGKWTNFPEIPQGRLSHTGAGFLSSSMFLFSTRDKNYVIDLDKNGSVWNEYDLLPPQLDNIYFVGFVGGEEVYLSHGRLKKARDWTTLSAMPRRTGFPPHAIDNWVLYGDDYVFPWSRGPYFSLVDSGDGDDGCFSFCAGRFLIHRDSYNCTACVPYVVLDVFRGRPSQQLEWSGVIQFCSNLGDLDEIVVCGVFRDV